MSKCEFLVTKREGQVSAGTITLDDKGKLTIQPEKGYEILMENTLEEGLAASDVRVWFDSLPSEYDGSYLRARIL
jgi:hypothetical protein